jgi:putative FmdB family regulatory protein
MPTYEYVCSKCRHHFDLVQPITAKPLKTCPKDHCPQKTWGKGKVSRVVSGGGGLIFKGSGFYETDYRSENYKAAAKKDAASPSSGSSDSAKKDSSSSAAKATDTAKKETKSADSSKSSTSKTS